MGVNEAPSSRTAAPAREDEIVDAAIPVFLRFGYKKASMDAVAAAANLSRQAVYLHFPGKEALFSAVVDQLCQSTGRPRTPPCGGLDWRWTSSCSQRSRDDAPRLDAAPRRAAGHRQGPGARSRRQHRHAMVDGDRPGCGTRSAEGAGGSRAHGRTAARVLQATSYGLKDQDRHRAVSGRHATGDPPRPGRWRRGNAARHRPTDNHEEATMNSNKNSCSPEPPPASATKRPVSSRGAVTGSSPPIATLQTGLNWRRCRTCSRSGSTSPNQTRSQAPPSTGCRNWRGCMQ